MLQFDNLTSQQKDTVAKVQTIIVVVNSNELSATMCYLAPPDHQNAVLKIQCKSLVGPDNDTRIFYVGKFGKCPVAVTQVQQGRGKDAVYHARKEFFKNLVLIAAVGVAAGFPENGVKLGDVLISDQIQDCSIYKRQDEDFPRGNKMPASKFTRQLLNDYLDWKYPCTKDEKRDASVKFGLILSKSMLLDNKAERERLLKHFGKEAKGFEMEGFGIMDSSLDFIVIKGVCDLGNKKDDLWQPTAALAANDYLHHHFCQTDLSLLIENEEGAYLRTCVKTMYVHTYVCMYACGVIICIGMYVGSKRSTLLMHLYTSRYVASTLSFLVCTYVYRIRQNVRGGKLSRFSRILAKRECFTIETFPALQLENNYLSQ